MKKMCSRSLKDFPWSRSQLVVRTEFKKCYGTVTPEAMYSQTSMQMFFFFLFHKTVGDIQ